MQAPRSFQRLQKERRLLSRWLPDLDRAEAEMFAERAAVREHDGGASKHAAEFGALEEVMRERLGRWSEACQSASDERFAEAEEASRQRAEAEIERQVKRWGHDRLKRWDRARAEGLGVEEAFGRVVGGAALGRLRAETWTPLHWPDYPAGADEVLALNSPAHAEELAQRQGREEAAA